MNLFFFQKNIIIKLFIIIFFLFFLFTYGFLVGLKKIFPYDIIIKTYYFINSLTIEDDQKINISSLYPCDLKEIYTIPPGSSVFIGHAYGSPAYPKNYDEFINQKVLNFINKNIDILDSIIFTGDVFDIPSLSKFNKLFLITKNVKLYLAPGNHDVLRPDSRDVFNLTKFGEIEYPLIVNSASFELIVEDSISTNWSISNKTLDYMNDNDKKNIIIARHNVPIKELLPYVNSQAGIGSDLDTLNSLNKKVTKGSFTWIIGDTGAFENLPRIKCLDAANHRFILNGIGDKENDMVIIVNNGDIFKFKI